MDRRRRTSPPARKRVPRNTSQRDDRRFHFTSRIRILCEDIVTRLPEMQHIDMSRVAVSFSQARKRTLYGLHAKLTPMRFEGGEKTGVRNGRRYATQQMFDGNGREILYILSFYLPRFLDTVFHEKLVTVFHELWHISEHFNGDIRRHPGRCYAHSHSQKEYDAEMSRMVDRWLALSPPEPLYQFLRFDFDQIQQHYGSIVGIKIPHPKLLPLE